jgi:hypothetical protein
MSQLMTTPNGTLPMEVMEVARKIIGFVILALLIAAAFHPNNRYTVPATQSQAKSPTAMISSAQF